MQKFTLVTSARSSEDAKILVAQLDLINRMMLQSMECTTFHRDLIDVFSFWKHRSQTMGRTKNAGIERIKEDLLKIVVVGLGKNFGVDFLVSLFRSLTTSRSIGDQVRSGAGDESHD